MGAEIKIVTSAGPRYNFVSTAGSYLLSSDRRVHFGLEANTIVRFIGLAELKHWSMLPQILKIDEFIGTPAKTIVCVCPPGAINSVTDLG
ncbi:ASPIC/UnbV domain-containing protein [Granulicella sp. S190]|uniref:ASPIC/UnbV domain-containing protein n=1 Tax=Granulicella sp. S190 TaxID=1747226 RepID=UPI00131D5F96|nr:ASPIC/UnbV domain-containing protein [Granulicella sp. S190]